MQPAFCADYAGDLFLASCALSCPTGKTNAPVIERTFSSASPARENARQVTLAYACRMTDQHVADVALRWRLRAADHRRDPAWNGANAPPWASDIASEPRPLSEAEVTELQHVAGGLMPTFPL